MPSLVVSAWTHSLYLAAWRPDSRDSRAFVSRSRCQTPLFPATCATLLSSASARRVFWRLMSRLATSTPCDDDDVIRTWASGARLAHGSRRCLSRSRSSVMLGQRWRKVALRIQEEALTKLFAARTFLLYYSHIVVFPLSNTFSEMDQNCILTFLNVCFFPAFFAGIVHPVVHRMSQQMAFIAFCPGLVWFCFMDISFTRS